MLRVPLQLGGVLKEWVEAPSLEPYRKIDGREIVTAVIGTLERYTLTDAAREDYLASYAVLVTYPDAGHGSLFQFHNAFVRQAMLYRGRGRPPAFALFRPLPTARP